MSTYWEGLFFHLPNHRAASADDYLSFMEEERPEVDAALQPSVEGMNYVFAEAGVGVEQGNREEVGSLGGGRTSKGEIV